jgi:hypothetical protein
MKSARLINARIASSSSCSLAQIGVCSMGWLSDTESGGPQACKVASKGFGEGCPGRLLETWVMDTADILRGSIVVGYESPEGFT